MEEIPSEKMKRKTRIVPQENRIGEEPIYTYSVEMYYTKPVLDVTPDIDGFIDHTLAVTNVGYMNSNIRVRVKKHCSEMAVIIKEGSKTMGEMLTEFSKMKRDLRNTADVAHLLVKDVEEIIHLINIISWH